jgi:hypothetical protein
MSFLVASASQVAPPAYDDCANNNYNNEAEVDEDGQVAPPAYDNFADNDYNDDDKVDGDDKNDEDNEDNDKRKSPYELFVEKKIEINNDKLRSLGLLSTIAPPKQKAIKSTKKRKMSDSATQQLPPCKCAMMTIDKTLMTTDYNFICVTVGGERIEPDIEVEELEDNNDNIYFICNTAEGELVCCDNCSNACHEVLWL